MSHCAKKLVFQEALEEALIPGAANQLTREVWQLQSPTLTKNREQVHHENIERDSEVEDEVH